MDRVGRIECDVSNGPVVVEVEEHVDLQRNARLVAIGSAAGSGADQILFKVGGDLSFGAYSQSMGTFLARNDRSVTLGQRATLEGALYAGGISLKLRSRVVGNPASALLPAAP